LLGERHAGSLHLNENLICTGCGYAALLNRSPVGSTRPGSTTSVARTE
jgi:hypothetical protein